MGRKGRYWMNVGGMFLLSSFFFGKERVREGRGERGAEVEWGAVGKGEVR